MPTVGHIAAEKSVFETEAAALIELLESTQP